MAAPLPHHLSFKQSVKLDQSLVAVEIILDGGYAAKIQRKSGAEAGSARNCFKRPSDLALAP